jgi:hypothetical protein
MNGRGQAWVVLRQGRVGSVDRSSQSTALRQPLRHTLVKMAVVGVSCLAAGVGRDAAALALGGRLQSSQGISASSHLSL